MVQLRLIKATLKGAEMTCLVSASPFFKWLTPRFPRCLGPLSNLTTYMDICEKSAASLKLTEAMIILSQGAWIPTLFPMTTNRTSPKKITNNVRPTINYLQKPYNFARTYQKNLEWSSSSWGRWTRSSISSLQTTIGTSGWPWTSSNSWVISVLSC